MWSVNRAGDLESFSDIIAHMSYWTLKDVDVVKNTYCECGDDLLIH